MKLTREVTALLIAVATMAASAAFAKTAATVKASGVYIDGWGAQKSAFLIKEDIASHPDGEDIASHPDDEGDNGATHPDDEGEGDNGATHPDDEGEGDNGATHPDDGGEGEDNNGASHPDEATHTPDEPVTPDNPTPAEVIVEDYEIAFNANGGKGKMANQKMKYGVAKKLAKNKFKRKNYVFGGWALSKKGKVAYNDKQKVSNLTKDGGVVNFYARWAKKNYKVKFYRTYGKVLHNRPIQQFTYGKSQKLMANKFKRNGYSFVGWAKSKKQAKKGKVTFKNKQKVKNLTLTGKSVRIYAAWKKK